MRVRTVAVCIALAVVALGFVAHFQRRDVAGDALPVDSAPAERLTPYFQFVNAELHAGAEQATAVVQPVRADPRSTSLPVATIRYDTRYVLPGVVYEGLVYAEKVPVGPNGAMRFHAPLPPALAQAKRLLVKPQIKVGGKKRALPSFEAELGEENGKRIAVVILSAPDVAGSTIGVFAQGFTFGPGAGQPHQTARVRIPEGAVLEFAMGIAEAAWSQGPARFAVEACDGGRCELLFRETVDPSVADAGQWQPRRISLQQLAGSERSFRFTAESASWNPRALPLPLWGNPTIYAPLQAADDAPNVILLSIDTLAAQHLTTYGSANDTAPFIRETFERDGVVFDHCVAAASTTPPSHMSMFTSLHPCIHKLQSGFEVIPTWIVTLAERLRAAGLETGAVTEDGWLGIGHGFGRGFNTYVENTSPDLMEPLGQIGLTFGKAEAWLKQHGNKRFFLFLHTFQVHDPYAPPPEYKDRYVADVELLGDEKRPLRDRVHYDREIRYTDDQLRKLFASIAALDLSRRTVFLVTSDHGEEFFEHGLWGHGGTLYQEVTHVPLMAFGPGVARGKRVAATVGHVDILPTILGLARVPVPSSALGIDLSTILQDPDQHPVPTRPLFSEAWAEVGHGVGYELVKFERPAYMVQVGTEKLMRLKRQGNAVYERYDLAVDPRESQNLFAADAPDAAGLRPALDGYEETCRLLSEKLAQQAGGSAEKVGTVPLSPEQEEKLRALGYLQ